MIKTEMDVEQDFYDAIHNTSLSKLVKGQIFKKDMRPSNRKTEDVVVIVSSLSVEQNQLGVVTIVTFVPMVNGRNNGELLPDKVRIGEIQRCYVGLSDELTKCLSEYDGLKPFSNIMSNFSQDERLSYVSCQFQFTHLTI